MPNNVEQRKPYSNSSDNHAFLRDGSSGLGCRFLLE
jgi:hypothetical protein